MRLAGVAAIVLVSLALAGCGAGSKPSSGGTRCVSPRAIARLRADISAIRRAAALPTSDRLKGNAAVNAATDRFLADVALAKIDNKQRNRMIDYAAVRLAGACEQCFQALEAARPVVNIRLSESGC